MMRFISRVRSLGNSYYIGVPKKYVKYYDLENKDVEVEIVKIFE